MKQQLITSCFSIAFLGSNLSQFYVHLDDRANDLLTTTSVTQVTSDEYDTLKMTTAQVVETSVTVNINSPIQDYVHPDDQTHPFEMNPGFKPFTV